MAFAGSPCLAAQAGAAGQRLVRPAVAGGRGALSVALRAFGDHLWLPVLIVVITLAGFIGDISPSPGGMGVVEAGMILGLTAAGVSESDATAAVFIQRLFTSYLPPVWGWAVLVWMPKKEYL
jgi:glycosyltransferase 2 family protein